MTICVFNSPPGDSGTRSGLRTTVLGNERVESAVNSHITELNAISCIAHSLQLIFKKSDFTLAISFSRCYDT